MDTRHTLVLAEIGPRRFHQHLVCVCAKSLHSRPTLYDPMECSPPGSSALGDSPCKYTGVGCHALLQGIFPAQGSNLHLLLLLHCRWILYRWATREATNILEATKQLCSPSHPLPHCDLQQKGQKTPLILVCLGPCLSPWQPKICNISKRLGVMLWRSEKPKYYICLDHS